MDADIGNIRNGRIVSHYYHAAAFPMSQITEYSDDVFAVLTVKAAGRFVSKDDWAACCESSGDCNSLLFTAGKRRRQALVLLGIYPDIFKAFMCEPECLCSVLITDNKRIGDILFDGEPWKQIIVLIDK